MICFLVCRPHGYTVGSLQRDAKAPKIELIAYDAVIRERHLPRATFVFTDLDRLGAPELVSAGRLYRRLAANGCQVLNDPTRVLTRVPLLRRLYENGINPFNVYYIDEADKVEKFPVFVRVADDHGGPLTNLISDRETLGCALEALVEIGYPPATLVIVEYAAEPTRSGIFRKLSVLRVADRYLPHVCVHDVNWIIKAGRSGVATRELYDEELEILRTNPFAEPMKTAFEIAGIDYGRVDFSFVDGRPCIYEINTNPTIGGPSPHPFPQRVESMKLWWESLLSALHAIDTPEETPSRVDVSSDHFSTLSQALEKYPLIKRGFLDLSSALSRRGDGELAVKYSKRALAESPGEAKVALRVSSLMERHGRLEEAIDVARQGVVLDPHNLELILMIAKLLAKAKRGNEALEVINGAVRSRPKDARSYLGLSDVQRRLGNLGAALKALDAAIELVSKSSGSVAAKQLKELRGQKRALQARVMRQYFRAVRARLVRILRGK
jgi:tetratricopeptide (TPR) repeat protein